jgi:hypothetical protein
MARFERNIVAFILNFTSLKTRHKSINPSSAPYSHPETHYEMNLCPFFHSIKDLSFQSRLFFLASAPCVLCELKIFFFSFFFFVSFKNFIQFQRLNPHKFCCVWFFFSAKCVRNEAEKANN